MLSASLTGRVNFTKVIRTERQGLTGKVTLDGRSPNPAFAAIADSLTGSWKQLGNPCRGPDADLTLGAHGIYVLPVAGKPGAFIFIADQWRPKNAIDGCYVWLPITLSADNFIITWRDTWDISVFEVANGTR